MNQSAYDAIEQAWNYFVKTRALCPWTTEASLGQSRFKSPGWYQKQGASFIVERPALKQEDVVELQRTAEFVNRSFVILMTAILESHGSTETSPKAKIPGARRVKLLKRLRNHYAHGDWNFDSAKPEHVETAKLLEQVFPGNNGFELPTHIVLIGLKDGVLDYIKAKP